MKKVNPKNINSYNNPIRFSFWTKYKGIKRRCLNLQRKDYKYYGGRGIKILWKSFDEFKIDMFNSYLKHVKKYGLNRGTSLERINNNGNYSKENCRWATMDEQCKNKRNNKLLIYNGETKLMIDWCKKLKLNYPMITYRILQKWPIEEAFYRPKHYKRKALLKIIK